MAQTSTFHCSIITPERTVLETDASFVAFPAHDGEMGILPNRAPLVCKLGIGILRAESGNEKQSIYIDGGFAQMVNNRLTILTQQARTAKEVDGAKAEKALNDAKSMTIANESGFETRQKAIRRAQMQVQLARSGAR